MNFRVQFPEKLNIRHHPLIKALIGINSNSTGINSKTYTTLTRNYNLSSNLTLLEPYTTNFTTILTNMTYLETLEDLSENSKLNTTGIPLCPEIPPNLRKI